MKHTVASNSTDMAAEHPDSLQIRGSLSTWGTWERLIPDPSGFDMPTLLVAARPIK